MGSEGRTTAPLPRMFTQSVTLSSASGCYSDALTVYMGR